MKLQTLLEGGKIQVVQKGSFEGLKFPTGGISSVPDWKRSKEDSRSGTKLMVSDRREEAGVFIDGKGRVQLTTEKSGRSFNDLDDLVGWLNQKGFTQFIGIDDTV